MVMGALKVALLVLWAQIMVSAGGGQVEHIKKLIDSPLEDIQWVNERVVFVLSEKGNMPRWLCNVDPMLET